MDNLTALKKGMYTSVGHLTLLTANVCWSFIASQYLHSYVFLAYAMVNVILIAVHIPTMIHREKIKHFVSDEVKEELKKLQNEQVALQTNLMAQFADIKQLFIK